MHGPGEIILVPGDHLLVSSPGDQEIFSWGGAKNITERESPVTRRLSNGLFTRRPGDFLLGGGRLRMNFAWTRRNSSSTRRSSPGQFTRRPGYFLLGGGKTFTEKKIIEFVAYQKVKL